MKPLLLRVAVPCLSAVPQASQVALMFFPPSATFGMVKIEQMLAFTCFLFARSLVTHHAQGSEDERAFTNSMTADLPA